jgi:hypothetical protein
MAVALQKITHGEQAQRDFGGFIESKFKILRYTVACQARLIEKCSRHNTYMVLCVNRIPPEPKNQFPEVLCEFRTMPEQKPDSFLSGKFPSLRNS